MADESTLNIASEYIKSIPVNLGLSKAYLFGSYSKGNQYPDSDIDIAVILKKIDNFFDVQMQLMRLRRNIDLRIEAHPIAETDFIPENPFAYEIINTGIRLI